MLTQESVPLPVLFEKLLESLAAGEVTLEVEEQILERLPGAHREEIEHAVYVLWRLMRHINREDCWTILQDELQNNPRIRDEIANWFRREPPREVEEALRMLREMPPGAIREVILEASNLVNSLEEQGRRIGEISGQLQGVPDSMENYLAFPDTYLEDCWFPLDAVNYQHHLRKHFPLFRKVTGVVRSRIGEGPLFWGVLGPIEDALRSDDPRGFEDEIERGRILVLQTLGNTRRCDLWDYWLLFHYEREEMARRDASERLVRAVDQASWAELEAFFTVLDQQEEDPWDHIPETVLPEADGLWRRVIQRALSSRRAPSDQTSRSDTGRMAGPSKVLLARSGYYFWRTSERHYGPSLPLLTLGYVLERELGAYVPASLNVPPFLPFWAGARAAAEEGQWELARDGVYRALVGIAVFAGAVTSEEWQRAIEQFHFDVGFVREIVLRLGDDPQRGSNVLRLLIYLADDCLADRGVTEESPLREFLGRLGRPLNVRGIADEARLANVVGRNVWDKLTDRTRLILVEAEALFRTIQESLLTDYSAVGVNYRRAIENEFRAKLGPLIEPLLERPAASASLGEMPRAVQDAPALARRILAGPLVPDTRLFGWEFMRRAISICDGFLNEAAHARGLGLEGCLELRDILLEQGMLRDLLRSVQPASV